MSNKKSLLFWVASLLFFPSCVRVTEPLDPLLSRVGETIGVQVNGKETQRTKKLAFTDKTGRTEEWTEWQAESDGALCLKVQLKDARLGRFKSAEIALRELNLEKVSYDWRRYTTLPYTSGWQAGEEYCVKEFLVTNRTRFSKLPNGEYVLRVQVFGTENWDAQTIFLVVE